jgi:TonB family protein
MKRTARPLISVIVLFALGALTPVVAQEDKVVFDKDIRVEAYEELSYPLPARTQRIQGVVIVRVKLDDEGRATDAVAISGADALVGDCLANAKKWRFQPNLRKSAIIAYHFKMPGGECKSPYSLFILERPNLVTITGCEVPARSAR